MANVTIIFYEKLCKLKYHDFSVSLTCISWHKSPICVRMAIVSIPRTECDHWARNLAAGFHRRSQVS